MSPELALEDSGFESRAVSPFREMGACEAPWAEPGTTFKSLPVRFARHPGSVPSDFVSRAEAHDSGLCTADAATRRRSASDLPNLTLAGPDVNRNRKKHHDAAHWMPQMNRCRFAARVAEVRRKYALTVDARKVNAPERVLSACASTEMVVRSCEGGWSAAAPKLRGACRLPSRPMPCACGTTTETDGLPAARRGATASPRRRAAAQSTRS